MENKTQQFKVGQRVKIVGSEEELSEYAADGTSRIGTIEYIDPYGDDLRCKVILSDGSNRYFKNQHLEALAADPAPQPAAAIQYPPLRAMKNNHEPLLTWQQVLNRYELAERQPHLYLLGEYQFVAATELMMQAMLGANANRVIILDYNKPDDSIEWKNGFYRIFIITEGV